MSSNGFSAESKKPVREAMSFIIDKRYSHDPKFKSYAKQLSSAFLSLENTLREMRNSAGDAHSTDAVIDENISNLYTSSAEGLLNFLKTELK